MLDAHGTPEVDLATWTFEVDGLVEHPQKWSLDEFMQLPAVKVYADFHCVTRWSRLDNVWGGVPTREIAKLAGVKPEAKFVVAQAYDYGWTTNVPIEYFLNEDSLFAWSHDGAPIPPEHGGPVRLIIPQLYAWKSAKWVKGVRFLEHDQAGFLGRRRLSHARQSVGTGRWREISLVVILMNKSAVKRQESAPVVFFTMEPTECMKLT